MDRKDRLVGGKGREVAIKGKVIRESVDEEYGYKNRAQGSTLYVGFGSEGMSITGRYQEGEALN